jgi:hypothetical protein
MRYVVSLLLLAQVLVAQGPRRPRGIYAVVNIQEQNANEMNAKPPITAPAPLENFFIGLFQQLLSNPAVSGLVIYENWSRLNPNPLTDPNPYDWSYLDDAFNQAAAWNLQNPGATPKTIQIVALPGFQTPGWVLNCWRVLI